MAFNNDYLLLDPRCTPGTAHTAPYAAPPTQSHKKPRNLDRFGFSARLAQKGAKIQMCLLEKKSVRSLGGETTLYKPTGDQVNLKVISKTGMILLHDHRISHGVPELEKGVKYVIRTDVMYIL